MAWTRRRKLHHSLWASCEKCGVLELASAAFTLHSGFTGSEIKGCEPVMFPHQVQSEWEQGRKRLRLILVLRNSHAESKLLWLKGMMPYMDLWGALTAPQGSEYANLDISYVALAKFTFFVYPKTKFSTLWLKFLNGKWEKKIEMLKTGGKEAEVSSTSIMPLLVPL